MTAFAPILINERSGRVAVLRRTADGSPEQTETAAHGRWPSWSPDRSLVSRSTVVTRGEAGRAAILVTSPEGEERGAIHEGEPGVLALIAPNVPHYALWSPQGDSVSYVAATAQGLALNLTRLGGSLVSHRVAVGAPMFHSWSPDGSRIVLHAGSQLALFDVTSLTLTEIHTGAIGFRTPLFDRDGSRFVYAAPMGGQVSLVGQGLAGDARELGRFGGGLAFAWAGTRDELLVAVSRQGDGSSFEELWRVAGDGSARNRIARGPFVAFWPSPDGDRLVLLVPTQEGEGRVALQSRTVQDGRVIGAAEPLLLSDDARVAVAFFDQYALSHPVWAPDGAEVVLCGRAGTDLVPGSLGDAVGDYVMTWNAVRGTPLRRLVPAVGASFPRASLPGPDTM